MQEITPIILCGGLGARLWPLSRDMMPKQFQPADGAGTQSFFQNTVQRHRRPGFKPPIIVSNAQYQTLVQDQLSAISAKGQILLEPEARGTGPAVLAAALLAARRDPKALMLVAPSDHVISGDMIPTILAARTAAISGHIVLFGVTPEYAETGYGYILDAGAMPNGAGLRKCGGFVEKPSHFRASELIATDTALWASGLALFTAETIISEFNRAAPETLRAVRAALPHQDTEASTCVLDQNSFAQASQGATENLIYESSARLLLAHLDVEWDDAGCWSALHAIGKQDKAGNALQGDVLAVDTTNSLVRGHGRLVAVVGMSDLVVVDTPDALLVTQHGKCQDVRKVVNALKASNRGEIHTHLDASATDWPLDHRGQSLSLAQSGQIDVAAIRIKAGDSLHIAADNPQRIILLTGRLHVSSAQSDHWLTDQEQMLFDAGQSADVSNPDACDVEALLLTQVVAQSPQAAAPSVLEQAAS